MTIQIPKDVYVEIESVRQSGVTNMFNRGNVRQMAEECDFQNLLDWLDKTDDERYAKLIMEGPEVVDENGNVIPKDDLPMQ